LIISIYAIVSTVLNPNSSIFDPNEITQTAMATGRKGGTEHTEQNRHIYSN